MAVKRFAQLDDNDRRAIHIIDLTSPNSIFTSEGKVSLENTPDYSIYFSPFRSQTFYSEALIQALIDKGVPIMRSGLNGIARLYKAIGEGEIVRLEDGSPAAGFIHILNGHQEDFDEVFQISDPLEMIDFILATVSTKAPHSIISPSPKDSRNDIYIYELLDKHHNPVNFYVIIRRDDGYIVTAYPQN